MIDWLIDWLIYTGPTEPLSVIVVDETFTTLDVAWLPSTSEVDYYIVTVMAPYDAFVERVSLLY